MGDSPTPRSADAGPGKPRSVVAVAYSGGRDSTALLHATWRACRAEAQCGRAAAEVVALHVHHGLSAQADDWLAHGQAQCAQWAHEGGGLRWRAHRLSSTPARGDSVEAWARDHRHQALAAMAREEGASVVLLAHHQGDQAETFLLQALRGAGAAGLSAMPPRLCDAEGLWWCRPWLDRPRSAIEAYVAHHRLSFIDDDSNANPRFARNRLRLQVWPAWTAAFPQAEHALAQAARRAQEAQACLTELADMDLAEWAPHGVLRLIPWGQASLPRRGNALRAWLARSGGGRPSRALIERLLVELGEGAGAPARWPCGAGELRRYDAQLSFAVRGGQHEAVAPRNTATPATVAAASIVIAGSGRYAVAGWAGTLVARLVDSGGLPWAPGENLHLCLRARQGGEQFQAGPRQPPRSLKKQFQAARIPAWQRDGPLVFQGETLVFIPGLGLDARAWAPPGVPQLGLHWEASNRLPTP